MGILRKYAVALVLAMILAAIYVYAPLSLEDVAKLRWLHDINAILNNFPASAKQEVFSVDPTAAANVDENLYRIAQRVNWAEGWRSFLAAHPDGPHLQSMRAGLDKLVPVAPPALATAQAPNGESPELKTPNNAGPPGRSSAGSEIAAATTDERAPAQGDSSHLNLLLGQTCANERSELDGLRQEPSPEAAGLFWRNLQCEELRPQARLLLDSLNVAPDSVASAAASSEQEARGAPSDAPTAVGVDRAACGRKTGELNRVRATPERGDAKRFASAVTCDALRRADRIGLHMPQVPIALWAVGALAITVLSAIPLVVSFLSWRMDGHWGHAGESGHPIETGGQPLSPTATFRC